MSDDNITIFEEGLSGRQRSGKARMAKLSAKERHELAARAAQIRWAESRDFQIATHIGEIQLADGQVALPCAVLEDGTRVLTQSGFLAAIGRKGGAKNTLRTTEQGVEKAIPFLDLENLKPFVSDELRAESRPIPFSMTNKGRAWGYKADILPKVCDVYLRARDANALHPAQLRVAAGCDILIRGLAQVGIIALVDEATGYQRDRARDALAQILAAFIAKELQPWVKTFPSDYYEQLFRIRGLDYPADSVKRPQYFGVLTNDIVYDRLAPGVLQELKKAIPRNEAGRPTAKYFQKLTANLGYPKLREHLGAVVALMRISENYGQFITVLDQHYPRHGQLALPYDPAFDSGQGL